MAEAGLLRRMRNWRLLPPADREFYDLFEEMVQTLIEASGKLVELYDAPRPEREEINTRIETCSTRCSRVAEQLEALLKRAQQPPFDRPEISLFVNRALRVMKYVRHAGNRYLVYDFPFSDKEMRELAPIIHEACGEIDKAVKALPRNRRIDPFCHAVDELETKADDIYHHGLRRRFQEIRADRQNLEARLQSAADRDATAELLSLVAENVEYTRHVAIFFILREVYAELERATDACTEVATTLKNMVAENV